MPTIKFLPQSLHSAEPVSNIRKIIENASDIRKYLLADSPIGIVPEFRGDRTARDMFTHLDEVLDSGQKGLAISEHPWFSKEDINELKGKNFLEIGVGNGCMPEQLRYFGVDNSFGIDRELNEQQICKPSIYLKRDASNTGLKDNSMDVVFVGNSAFLYGSKEEQEKVLVEIHRILKPGGRIRILGFNNNSIDALSNKQSLYKFPNGWKEKDKYKNDFGQIALDYIELQKQ